MSLDGPNIAAVKDRLVDSEQIPQSVQSLFWSDPHVAHSVEKDAREIIHKVLAFGTVNDIRWLKRTYAQETLQQVFRDQPMPLYTQSAFHFASTVILHLDEASLNRQKYVKSVY